MGMRWRVGTSLGLLSLEELERRCQKPEHRRIGNWMARRISRPAALRITRVVAPWGVSANVATVVAWACAAAASATFGWGTIAGWWIGAALLQLWYLLDHVDGQLARLHGTASLDGVQLDYLMHHTINLLVPLGIGWGLFARTAEPIWCLAAVAWGLSLLVLGLHHDARYKAFVQRLKILDGTLLVVGGGGFRSSPQPPMPLQFRRLAGWSVRKACEGHVVMNSLTALALAMWLFGDQRMLLVRGYLTLAGALAGGLAAWTLWQSQRQQACEQEFAAWFRVPPGHELIYLDGGWKVLSAEAGKARQAGDAELRDSKQSS